MTGTVAIIAHFDPDNRLDPTFRSVLACLKEVCDQIVLVTTCNLPPSEVPTEPSIITIQRPNVGYDFYSYRVGIDQIRRQGGYERLFVLNSSFLILNRQRFINTLAKMLQQLREVSIVGITKSLQFELHLQSYLILLRGDVLTSSWFQAWLQQIEPRNNKLETILAGELGLARILAKNRIATTVILRLTRRETLQAYFAWGRRLFSLNGLSGLVWGYPLRHIREFNPVHFAARPLAEHCGLVKAELLRDNPHGLDIGWVDAVTSTGEQDTVRKFIERSRRHYQSVGNGLTVFNNGGVYLPACQLVCSGPLARPGIRVAVVVHIFYPELIDEICVLLRNILEPFDLLATTPHEEAIPVIFDRCTPFAQSIAVALCENRGRDIGPFMAIHRRRLLEPYQAILKLHTKRSTYSDQGGSWRQSLFHELCGNSLAVQNALEMLRTGRVGIIGPHSSYLTHQHFWGANREKARSLLGVAGIHHTADVIPLGFFAGSMFWFNPAALAPLHAIPQGHLAFEPEAGQQDGTLAHAFERIFCNIARSTGYVTTSLTLGGEEIDSTATDCNTVPVLSAPLRPSSELTNHV